jgi:uncharacterized protein (TIRG00374 family)
MFHQLGNLFEIIPAMSRKLLFLLALCAIAAIVAYWAFGSGFNWGLFVESLEGVKVGWLIAGILLTFVTYWLRALRWKILLTPLKIISVAPLFALTTVGFAAIYALGRPAELARPLWLARRESVPVTGSIATIVVERIFDMIMIACLLGVALAAVEIPPGSEATLGQLKRGAWLILGFATLAGLALVVIRTRTQWIVGLIRYRKIASWIESFAQGLSFLRSGKTFALLVLESVVLWVIIAVQFWFLLLGMNFDFSLGTASLVMVAAAVGSLVQIPGIGGGFQVAFFFCMTTLFQIPAERATAASLIAWAFSYGPTIAAAAVYMVTQGISLRELKSTIQKPESNSV